MAKLEFDDEGSRMVEAINTVPDTIERRRTIMRTLNLKTGERVLDVGSGPGHQVLEMSPMVGPSGRIDGVDISESMLRIARARCEGATLSSARAMRSTCRFQTPHSTRLCRAWSSSTSPTSLARYGKCTAC